MAEINHRDTYGPGTIVIIGTGMMGHGIVLDFARHGFHVTMLGRNKESLQKGLQAIESDLSRIRALGLHTEGTDDEVLSRIKLTDDKTSGLREAKFVVEAIIENLEQKQSWFRHMGEVCRPDTILTTTTGSILPSQLASVTKNPERVLGAHYINPPYLQPLVEVIRHPATSDESVKATASLLNAARKHPVVLEKEIEGFVLNRIQVAIVRECLSLVEQGVTDAAGVDTIVRQTLGRRLAAIGPLEAVELGMGWDLALQVANVIMPKLSAQQHIGLMKELAQKNHLGLKSGKGLYDWSPEKADELRTKLGQTASALSGVLDQKKSRQ